jgi:hypothetical protein
MPVQTRSQTKLVQESVVVPVNKAPVVPVEEEIVNSSVVPKIEEITSITVNERTFNTEMLVNKKCKRFYDRQKASDMFEAFETIHSTLRDIIDNKPVRAYQIIMGPYSINSLTSIETIKNLSLLNSKLRWSLRDNSKMNGPFYDPKKHYICHRTNPLCYYSMGPGYQTIKISYPDGDESWAIKFHPNQVNNPRFPDRDYLTIDEYLRKYR